MSVNTKEDNTASNDRGMRVFQPVNACDGYRRNEFGEPIPDTSLSVRLTASCDNSCSFCIAAEDMKISHQYKEDTVIEKTLASGTDTVSIIGGEPLLFLDRLEAYLEAVRDKVKDIYITTSLPITIQRSWDQFERIMSKIDFITISIQDINYEANNELMNSKKRFDRISVLKKILEHDDMREKVTVNLNLVQGGIDTEDKFFDAIYALDDWGLKHLRINELMHAPSQYVNFEDMMGMQLASPYANGCKTELDFIDGMEIFLKRSCFMVEQSLVGTAEDYRKVEDKLNNPEKYTQEGWRILYEHGEYDLKWRETRREGRKMLDFTVKRNGAEE